MYPYTLKHLLLSYRYDPLDQRRRVSKNISTVRVSDSEFDFHLIRLVMFLRVKEIKVTNGHVKVLLVKRILSLAKYVNSPAQNLKFSNC